MIQGQILEVEKLLGAFLPKMKSQPGVVAIHHYPRPEVDDESTVTILGEIRNL